MPLERADPVFELALDVPPEGSRRRLRELHRQLRAAILEGRLAPGLRLPSTRALAARLGASRGTAATAYDMLRAEGLLVSRAGAGSFVAARPAAGAARPRAAAPAALDPRLPRAPLRFEVGGGAVLPERIAVNLRFGLAEERAFPFDVWRRLAGRVLREHARAPRAAFPAAGVERLRAAIAGHVAFTRAVACDAGSVVVTSGAQGGFDLIARTLVRPGESVVAVEDPGYPPAWAAFAAAGARLVPVPVDERGLRVDRLPEEARIVYVTPSHQFPTGVEMAPERRRALLAFAAERRAVVVEDDYDGEFRFAGRPLDALQTLDREGSVVYVGTFSKSLFAALRVGFVVAPPWLWPALVATKRIADWSSPGLTQLTLAAFLEEGHLARHIRRARALYAPRRAALLEALAVHGRGWLRPLPSSTGLHLAARLEGGARLEQVAAAALAAGVALERLDRYALAHGACDAVGFGYGAAEPDAIAEALRRLAQGVRGAKASAEA